MIINSIKAEDPITDFGGYRNFEVKISLNKDDICLLSCALDELADKNEYKNDIKYINLINSIEQLYSLAWEGGIISPAVMDNCQKRSGEFLKILHEAQEAANEDLPE